MSFRELTLNKIFLKNLNAFKIFEIQHNLKKFELNKFIIK